LQTTVYSVVSLVGLSVWPASILLSQWVAKLARDNALPDMHDKMVLELGAGCGLPVIVAGEC
jgi:predicted nicotinamide N-methyase